MGDRDHAGLRDVSDAWQESENPESLQLCAVDIVTHHLVWFDRRIVPVSTNGK